MGSSERCWLAFLEKESGLYEQLISPLMVIFMANFYYLGPLAFYDNRDKPMIRVISATKTKNYDKVRE